MKDTVIFVIAFIISFLFAVLQMYLLKELVFNITGGNKSKVVKIFGIKFLLYGIAIALFMFKFMKYIMFCFCGFTAGMPLAAFGYFIYCSFIKKK